MFVYEVIYLANCCDFDIRISGQPEAVLEMASLLKVTDSFLNENALKRHFGGVYYCDFEDYGIVTVGDGLCYLAGGGSCAWSIQSSMREEMNGFSTLERESKRLGIMVEAYSSEPGIGFQEHVLIVKGEVVIDDCVDYKKHYVESAEKLEAYNKANDTDFTEDMINADGDVCIGGFGDDYGVYCVVSNQMLAEYGKETSSLDEKILEANSEVQLPINHKGRDELSTTERGL